MLRIRQEQIDTLGACSRTRFEAEMVDHCKSFSPRLSEVIGDDQLHVAVRGAMARADAHELTLRGPMRLCVELMLLFGSSFDTDPQYPWIASSLADADDQMGRAGSLYRQAEQYLDVVAGPDDAHVLRALRRLRVLADDPPVFSPRDLGTQLVARCRDAYPEKFSYVGGDGVRQLAREALELADDLGAPDARGRALVCVLMFAFGHGCVDDPLFPWIGRTLRAADKPIDVRLTRLERKATTWLDHVLGPTLEGEPP